jgi:hypothetical protein
MSPKNYNVGGRQGQLPCLSPSRTLSKTSHDFTSYINVIKYSKTPVTKFSVVLYTLLKNPLTVGLSTECTGRSECTERLACAQNVLAGQEVLAG